MNLSEAVKQIRDLYPETEGATDLEVLFAFAAAHPPQRMEGEDFNDYKTRRKLQNYVGRELAKGYRA